MGEVMNDIWPMLVTAVITGIGTYVGFIHKLRVKVAVMEEKVERLQARVDSHSKKTDDIIHALGDFKDEIVRQLGEIAVDIAKINTTLNIVDRDSAYEAKRL